VTVDDLGHLLPSAPLTGNSSMSGGNQITDESGSFTAPGSPSEGTSREPVGSPMPEIPAARGPSVLQDGHSSPRGGDPYDSPAGGGWFAAGDDAHQMSSGGWVTP
jgi:hypothetical protein